MARQIIRDPQERKDWMNNIQRDYDESLRYRQDWLRDKTEYLLMYRSVPPPGGPKFEGDPDFVVPVAMTTVETLQSRLVNALLGLEDLVQARPFKNADMEKLELVAEFLNWETQVEMKFPEVIDDWVHDILVYGIGIMMIRWRRDVRMDKRIECFPANAPPMFPAMKRLFDKLGVPVNEGPVSDREYIDVLFDPDSVDQVGDHDYIVTHTRRGTTVEVEVYVDRRDVEFTGEVEVEITEEVVIYDGPEAVVVDIEDFVMPPGYKDIQTAPYCFNRRWMSYNEIARAVEKRIFDIDKDTLATLRTASETKNASRIGDAKRSEDEIKQVKGDISGYQAEEMRRTDFEVIDAYYRTDINDDGFDEEIVISFIKDKQVWCGAQYLSVYYPHRRRPFVAGRIIPLTNQFEGIGIPEMVAPFQEELSAILNEKLRKDAFTSTPWGGFRPASGMTAREIKIEPGLLIPMDNPKEDLYVITLSPNTAADVGNINMLLNFLEKLTGVSDLAAGTFGSRPNAPRTFGATAAILQEGNVRYDTFRRRVSAPIGEAYHHIYDLASIFMPDEKEFFVVGSNEVRQIDRNQLQGRYSFMLTTNTVNTNKAVMRDFATFVYQSLMANPLIQSSVGAMYKLTKKFAEAHEVPNFEEILPPPPEAQLRAPMEQMEEIIEMASGNMLHVIPTDDDQEHIEVIMKFLESEQSDNFPVYYTAYLMMHLQEHNQQMQAKGSGATPQGANTQDAAGNLGEAAPLPSPAQASTQPAGGLNVT